MNKEQETLKDIIEDLEESVEFFSNKNKKERELWIVKEFLKILDIHFDEKDFKTDCPEPIDISFRNANFQIKELLDKNRKRHKEFKDDLKKAKSATHLSELTEPYNAKIKITLQEIVDCTRILLNDYHIDPKETKRIDFLVYENLTHYVISDYNYILPDEFTIWRSFSMVGNGGLCCVFFTKDDAPDFIKSNLCKIIRHE
jgi:hypothetical protein